MMIFANFLALELVLAIELVFGLIIGKNQRQSKPLRRFCRNLPKEAINQVSELSLVGSLKWFQI